MRYSFWLGELTEGYEWYDEKERKREEKTPPAMRIKLVFSMVFLLLATYISGAVVSSDITLGFGDVSEEADESVSVGAGSGAVNELDYADAIAENEREARINELVNAYIEEHAQAALAD